MFLTHSINSHIIFIIYHLTLLNAQDVANIIIKDDRNKDDCLKSEGKRIYHVKMIFVRASIAFTLMSVNKRRDANRIKIIRENTHVTHINKDLIYINAYSQSFIILFF